MQLAASDPIDPVISVTGRGSAHGKSEKHRLKVTSMAVQQGFAQAQAARANCLNRILETLHASGVAAGDVINVERRLLPFCQPERLACAPASSVELIPLEREGFDAGGAAQLRLRNPSRAGEFMDLVAAAGATSVELKCDDEAPAEVRSLARERAVVDATTKAQHLAALMNMRLGEPVHVQERETLWLVLPLGGKAAEIVPTDGRTPPVFPSSLIRVKVALNVSYRLSSW